MEADALFKRGWSITAIARHLGRDRKTVRSHLTGGRQAGVRRPVGPDPLAPFAGYVAARFVDDPHLCADSIECWRARCRGTACTGQPSSPGRLGTEGLSMVHRRPPHAALVDCAQHP